MDGFKSRYGSWHDLNQMELVIRTAIMTAYDRSCPLKRLNTEPRKFKWSKELKSRSADIRSRLRQRILQMPIERAIGSITND